MSDRASYTHAINWIALNDDCDLGNAETGYLVSINLVADIFHTSVKEVFNDVIELRSPKKPFIRSTPPVKSEVIFRR